jgi:hypothetical protein
MPELILPIGILAEIRDIVYATDTETGVRLIGIAERDRYIVRYVIGPGPEATERRYAYECDNSYAEDRFNAWLKENPALRFLGELHVHPDGFPQLSGQDRRTIAEVLREYPDFIAGVVQRNPLRLYPYLFANHSKIPMEVCFDLCPKSEGTRIVVDQERDGGRVWQRWLRRCRDACARRDRKPEAR